MTADYATRWRDGARRPTGLRARSLRAARHVVLSLGGVWSGFQDDRFLRCLFCHYVFDDQRERFRQILKGLRQVGTFVDTSACIAMAEGRRPVDGRYFHLSFDDGLRNNFDNAAPVLDDLEIPATFFISTAAIDSDYDQALHYSVEVMNYANPIEFLTWDQIRTLASWGFDIGSHTRNHVRISETRSRAVLEDEIEGSKRRIEDEIGQECRYIAWPFGTRGDVSDAGIEVIREAGYRACFGAFRGSVVPGETDLYRIPRHQFEVQWPESHVRFFASGRFDG